MGLIQALVSACELGKIRLNDEMVIRFAKALEVSADEILGLKFLADAQARREYWRRKIDGYPRMRDAEPNAGHKALARLFEAGYLKTMIPQNIDSV
jgi:NAD-dependent SIR2 family protein deacetylase